MTSRDRVTTTQTGILNETSHLTYNHYTIFRNLYERTKPKSKKVTSKQYSSRKGPVDDGEVEPKVLIVFT